MKLLSSLQRAAASRRLVSQAKISRSSGRSSCDRSKLHVLRNFVLSGITDDSLFALATARKGQEVDNFGRKGGKLEEIELPAADVSNAIEAAAENPVCRFVNPSWGR